MTHSNSWPLFAGATTIVAAGLVTGPVPAYAVPPAPLAPPACLQWAFAGPTGITNSGGKTVVNFNATGPSFNTTASTSALSGLPISGVIHENKFIQITLSMPGPPPATETYSGAVGDDGIARGTSSNTSPIVQSGGSWSTAAPLKCAKEAAPEKPKEGPTVSFDPILGGLNVHITDRSGVTSQCTYDADGFTRTFRLEANQSTDLRIVPAVPKLANWNINITCDNGTSTKTTQFF
jgi:YD repeat-containing protein